MRKSERVRVFPMQRYIHIHPPSSQHGQSVSISLERGGGGEVNWYWYARYLLVAVVIRPYCIRPIAHHNFPMLLSLSLADWHWHRLAYLDCRLASSRELVLVEVEDGGDSRCVVSVGDGWTSFCETGRLYITFVEVGRSRPGLEPLSRLETGLVPTPSRPGSLEKVSVSVPWASGPRPRPRPRVLAIIYACIACTISPNQTVCS